MSSIVFADSFNGAAAFIRSLHPGSAGLSVVLDDFRARTATDVRDPTVNRNLIIEPKEDAQLLGVPVETVQTVVHELRRLQLLHLWARAKCPNADEDDDAIIIETDNPDDFRDALEETCHVCGSTHGFLAWENLETFLAFNFDVTDKPLNLSDLIYEPPESIAPNKPGPSHIGAFKDWFRSFFVRRDGSPEAAVLKSLATNRPASAAPVALEFVHFIWARVLKYVVAVALICLTLYWWKGAPCAIGGGLIGALVLFILIWQSQTALGAATALERRICIASTGFGMVLAIKGATGFHLKGRISEKAPWYTSFDFGEADHHFLWAGVVCFLGGHLIVYGIQRNKVLGA